MEPSALPLRFLPRFWRALPCSSPTPDEKCIKLISLDFPACTLFIFFFKKVEWGVQCPDGWASHSLALSLAHCVFISHYCKIHTSQAKYVFPAIPPFACLIYFLPAPVPLPLPLPLRVMNITRCLLNLTHRCESNRKAEGQGGEWWVHVEKICLVMPYYYSIYFVI